ncbi:MAG: RNA-binding protein [Pseudomonadota bacterium]
MPKAKASERAGAAKARGARGARRTCLASRQADAKTRLIRFAVDGEGRLVPDLAEKLPGRGVWLSADRAAVETAVAKRLFAKAARRDVATPDDLAARLDELLARRCLDWLGLARRAGLLVLGFEKIKAAFGDARPAALVEACDGAEDGRKRLFAWAGAMRGPIPVLGCFTSAELGLALGQDNMVHGALRSGGATVRLVREMRRLAGFRPLSPGDWSLAWDFRLSADGVGEATDRSAERVGV